MMPADATAGRRPMSPALDPASSPAADAAMVAALFAVDPIGTGGVNVRVAAGIVRDQWCEQLRALLPPTLPWRKIPLHVSEDRLLGGVDLSATLKLGRLVAQRGLAAEIDGGIALLAMAERISPTSAARFTGLMEATAGPGDANDQRHQRHSRFGVIAFDEGSDEQEGTPPALLDRMAFHLDLHALRHDSPALSCHLPHEIAAARERMPAIVAGDAVVSALCATASALGIVSLRAPLLALRVARIVAALGGRDEVEQADATLAARLVLAPRVVTLPPSEHGADAEAETVEVPPSPPPESENAPAPAASSPAAPAHHEDDARDPPRQHTDGDARDAQDQSRLDDSVLAAVKAAIPSVVLARLSAAQNAPRSARTAGRSGASRGTAMRGRPVGVRRGDVRNGARLALVDTLRAAAPWQALRRRERSSDRSSDASDGARVEIRRQDFHIVRLQARTESTIVFVVDASGSTAMHRLAEAKGAAEHLLAHCYARRERVAVIAFRDRGAQVLLPPTRSLVRAKRSLAALPGGGGTPLASGLDAATALVSSIQRGGGTATVVLLTDGRANIARSGAPGRDEATLDALAAARAFRRCGARALLVDTSPRAHAAAAQLADAMGAQYVALPTANPERLSSIIRPARAQRGIARA